MSSPPGLDGFVKVQLSCRPAEQVGLGVCWRAGGWGEADRAGGWGSNRAGWRGWWGPHTAISALPNLPPSYSASTCELTPMRTLASLPPLLFPPVGLVQHGGPCSGPAAGQPGGPAIVLPSQQRWRWWRWWRPLAGQHAGRQGYQHRRVQALLPGAGKGSGLPP